MLGDLLPDHPLAAFFFGHIKQQAGDAAIDVEQRQAFDIAVGFAQPAHQNLHQLLHDLEVVLHAALEFLLAEGQQFAGFDGDDIGRPRAAVDQAHFSEKFTRTQPGENDLATFLIEIGHLGATGEQDDQGLRVFTRAHDLLATSGAPTHRRFRQALQFSLIEAREERYVAQDHQTQANIC